MSDSTIMNPGEFENLPEKFKENEAEAIELLKDPVKTQSKLDQVIQKLTSIRSGPIRELFENILLMISMVADWIKGRYKEIPVSSIIAILAALIYFLSPVDLLPDFIPGVGYIDDAFVIAVVLKTIYSDLQIYKDWKNKKI